MSLPERNDVRAALLALLLVPGAATFAGAQVLDPRAVFETAARPQPPSAEEILRRALDNLYGFDAAIEIRIEQRTAAGDPSMSEFLLQRRRFRGARCLHVTTVLPEAVRGNRVLQIESDDGTEETYAFVPGRDMERARSPYRVAEPFLVTWYAIGADEPSAQMRSLAEYEILGFGPGSAAGDEEAYLLSLRPIVPRGYDRLELVVARRDYAILEQRQYVGRSSAPALIATAPRESMVRFGDHLVPERIRYRDPPRNATYDVALRHRPLPESSDALFLPSSFHRVPVPGIDASPAARPDPSPAAPGS